MAPRKLPLGLISFFLVALFPAIALADAHEFRLDRPDAQSVGLAGEFNNWHAAPMTKGGDGVWSITLSLSPGVYGYKFLVNGSEWTFDPQNPQRKQVNGIDNSAIAITGEASSGALGNSAPPAASTPPSTPANSSAGDVPVTPGEVSEIDVPLSPPQQAQSTRGGNPPVVTAHVALGVPQNFDPLKSWPILIISATVDASNIELLHAYKEAALAAGWVILAADAPVRPKEDNTDRRLALIDGALDYLAAHWPGSKNWPVAAGGFSGGAKRSGFVAGWLMKEQRHVLGILMGGCNEDTATMALERFHPPYAFRLVPIFLSSGTRDQIADPDMIHSVEHSMKSHGFRSVRFASYDGAHEVYPEHTTAALEWFVAGPAPAPSATPKSDFEKFFKKP